MSSSSARLVDGRGWVAHELGPNRALRTARAVPEGLAVGGQPRWRNAEAVFTSGGLLLRHGDRSFELAWADDWSFAPFAVMQARSTMAYGTGIAHRAAAAALWPTWALPLKLVPLPGRRRRVAIESRIPWIDRPDEDVALLDALRHLLAHDRRAADRLDEPDRVAALAQAVSTWQGTRNRLQPRVQGGRVDAIDQALERAGHVHVTGRPLPGWAGDHQAIVAEVTALLEADPEVREARLPQAEIEAVVGAHLTAVDPWPFGALVAD